MLGVFLVWGLFGSFPFNLVLSGMSDSKQGSLEHHTNVVTEKFTNKYSSIYVGL